MNEELRQQLLSLGESIYQAGVLAGSQGLVEQAVLQERARISALLPGLLQAEEADLELKLANLVDNK